MAVPPEPGRNVRRLLAAFALLVLGTLAWRAYSPHFGTRPTELVASSRSVDINTADRAELLQVPGIGPNLADAILAQRQAVGRFETLEDLDKVSGIGGKTLDKLRPWLTVSSPRTLVGPVERLERKPATPAKLTAGLINVNTATAEELQTLPGIGVKLAERMIAERERAKFTTAEDLRRVSGIGVKTVEKLRPLVTFGN